jgi:hypothetical protein
MMYDVRQGPFGRGGGSLRPEFSELLNSKPELEATVPFSVLLRAARTRVYGMWSITVEP